MERKSSKNKQFSKLTFPNWDEVIHSYLNEMNSEFPTVNISEYVKIFFDKIEEIRNIGFGNHIAQTMQIALSANALSKPEVEKSIISSKISNLQGEFNQFHSIFELNTGNFIYVDPNIETILGIHPNLFSIPNLFGLNPEIRLYHPNDVSHVIRWAGIAYGVLSFPNFKINSSKEYYKVNFRIATEISTNQKIKSRNFVELEKKCFLKANEDNDNLNFPRYHLDKWTVYDAENFSYVKPQFVSDPHSSELMNSLAYLMNAYLLDIHPKYLLMLNERKQFDRNKEIAFSLNKTIEQNCAVTDFFSENQIADTFAKTIRNKVYQTCKKWDSFGDYTEIMSEQQSLDYCNRLGLLPIPNSIISHIYRNISY
jgi:hypothetical protein